MATFTEKAIAFEWNEIFSPNLVDLSMFSI